MVQNITAIPKYTFNINKNIIIDTSKKVIIYEDNMDKYYTDGSNIKNPGHGGYAWLKLNNDKLVNKLTTNDYGYGFDPIPTTILMNEASALILLLKHVIKDKNINNKNIMYVHIDNLPLLNLIKGISFPKYDSIKKLIENIYDLCNKELI